MTNQNHGDVNLWGLEGPPNLSKKEEKLSIDNDLIDQFAKLIEKFDQKNIEDIGDTSTEERTKVSEKAETIVVMLSEREKS